MLQEETLAKKFVHRWFWLYLFTFLTAPLGYIIKSILSHDLSPSDVGVFYGIISLITILSAINDLGCTESLNYFLPKYIISKEYGKIKYLLKMTCSFQMLSSVIIIGFLWWFGDIISEYYFKNPDVVATLKIMVLYFLGNNILHICTVLFSATQNTKLSKATEFIRLLVTTGFTFSIFWLDAGNLEIYAYTWLSGILAGILFAGFFTYKNYYLPHLKNIPTQKDLELKKNFIKYAIPTFLTANISLLLSQIDAQLIIVLLWNESHGYYSNYLSVMLLPFIVLSPIVGFLFPVFTELHVRQDNKKIQFLYSNMSLFLLILSLWASGFLFQNGVKLVTILFSQAYEISGEILQYSVPFLAFNVLNQLNFQLLAGTGQAKARTFSFAIILPINILLNLIFIQLLWVHGSALAVWLSWIPLYWITLFFVRTYFSLPPILPIIYNIFGILCAFFLASWLTQNIANNFFALFINIILYGIIFLSINFSSLKNMLKIIKSNR